MSAEDTLDETQAPPVAARTRGTDADGTSKSLRRALRLLRIVAERDGTGIRLKHIAQLAEMHQATAHRLLSALVDEGMLWMDPDTKLYNLGVQMVLMADTARWAALRSHMHPVLESLARQLTDDVYLGVISGYDSVLIDKVQGTFAGRIAGPGLGTRRPLGVGAAAIALLAGFPLERAREIFQHNLPRYVGIPWITSEAIWEEVLATHKRGYTVVKGQLVEEATAVAVAFSRPDGRPLVAIGVSANNSRMLPERRGEIAQLIRAEVAVRGPLPSG